MALVGGVESWLGPVAGALLLGSLQQLALAFVSSSASLALTGFVFMAFVALAPQGLIGLRTVRGRAARRAMNAPFLQVRALGKRFGGFVALSGIDLSVARGERVGLIGPNGSGKSTFVNCLGGVFARHEGDIEFDGSALTGVPPIGEQSSAWRARFSCRAPSRASRSRKTCEIPLRFLGADGPICRSGERRP